MIIFNIFENDKKSIRREEIMLPKKFKLILVISLVIILNFFVLYNWKAGAQEVRYPVKPIEVVVPFNPGGPTDIWVRIVANELQKELGTTLSIQYKPGAGSMTGAYFVSTQKPDGYTLLAGSVSIISAPFLEKETAPYDVLKDFTPIATCIVAPNIIASHISSDLTSFDKVIKVAKENPGKLNCSTPGVGTTAHLILNVLKMNGIDITPIPTKGGGPAITSLLGKHVDLAVAMYNAAVPHVKSGTIRFLVSTDRIAQYPEISTLREKGFPECDALGSWQGFFGPANLPKAIQEKLNISIKKVIDNPSVKKALENAGYTIFYLGPDELKNKMEGDYKTIEKIAKAAGLGKYKK